MCEVRREGRVEARKKKRAAERKTVSQMTFGKGTEGGSRARSQSTNPIWIGGCERIVRSAEWPLSNGRPMAAPMAVCVPPGFRIGSHQWPNGRLVLKKIMIYPFFINRASIGPLVATYTESRRDANGHWCGHWAAIGQWPPVPRMIVPFVACRSPCLARAGLSRVPSIISRRSKCGPMEEALHGKAENTSLQSLRGDRFGGSLFELAAFRFSARPTGRFGVLVKFSENGRRASCVGHHATPPRGYRSWTLFRDISAPAPLI
jgi:hypothetical protein